MRPDTLIVFLLALLTLSGCETAATDAQEPYDDGDVLGQIADLESVVLDLQDRLDDQEAQLQALDLTGPALFQQHLVTSEDVACTLEWPGFSWSDSPTYVDTGISMGPDDVLLVSWDDLYRYFAPATVEYVSGCSDVSIEPSYYHDPPDALVIDGQMMLLSGDPADPVWFDNPTVAIAHSTLI